MGYTIQWLGVSQLHNSLYKHAYVNICRIYGWDTLWCHQMWQWTIPELNRGLNREVIYKSCIFQHAMFDCWMGYGIWMDMGYMYSTMAMVYLQDISEDIYIYICMGGMEYSIHRWIYAMILYIAEEDIESNGWEKSSQADIS